MTKQEAAKWVAFAQSIIHMNPIVSPNQFAKIEEACDLLEVKDLRTFKLDPVLLLDEVEGTL